MHIPINYIGITNSRLYYNTIYNIYFQNETTPVKTVFKTNKITRNYVRVISAQYGLVMGSPCIYTRVRRIRAPSKVINVILTLENDFGSYTL